MTAPNRNALWTRTFVDELVAAGVGAVCVSPGSRSTPLTVACYEHDDLHVYSHLDERSAAYFALGRARRTGEPTPLICTSGTAAANFHPAVIEATQARVPMVVCTADRPPELRDSGANQTIDQEKLYGDAVRWYRDLPEPEPEPRKLRRLRVDAARAVAEATGAPAGPVHLNFPFRKPLEPIEVEGDVPEDLGDTAPLAANGRDGAFVRTTSGESTPPDAIVADLADAIGDAERVLVVAGPADPPGVDGDALADLASAAGAPILADPLSDARFGDHVSGDGSDDGSRHATDPLVCGGYDAYLGPDAVDDWPDPDLVFRVGASPTSKSLRKYLAAADARQVLVDPAGGWREAEFTATDLVAADPAVVARALPTELRERGVDSDASARVDYRERFAAAERAHWSSVDDAVGAERFEGTVLATVADLLPDPSTLFVSNSMPVRDLDLFARPRRARIRALANRGASGIDGITSTALGAGSATDDPLVMVTGDLAYYHDMNGLLAIGRCGVDATIVLINNDGGGIFHKLPIEAFDPPFTEGFKTPHGLDFEPTGDLYELDFERVDDVDELRAACEASIGEPGATVIEIQFDAEESHRTRDELVMRVRDEFRERID